MSEPLSAKDAISEKVNAAFGQATRKIIQRAAQSGTPLVVWAEGGIREVAPEDLDEIGAKATGDRGQDQDTRRCE